MYTLLSLFEHFLYDMHHQMLLAFFSRNFHNISQCLLAPFKKKKGNETRMKKIRLSIHVYYQSCLKTRREKFTTSVPGLSTSFAIVLNFRIITAVLYSPSCPMANSSSNLTDRSIENSKKNCMRSFVSEALFLWRSMVSNCPPI